MGVKNKKKPKYDDGFDHDDDEPDELPWVYILVPLFICLMPSMWVMCTRRAVDPQTGSRRRRGYDVDSPWRQPRMFEETSRGDAARRSSSRRTGSAQVQGRGGVAGRGRGRRRGMRSRGRTPRRRARVVSLPAPRCRRAACHRAAPPPRRAETTSHVAPRRSHGRRRRDPRTSTDPRDVAEGNSFLCAFAGGFLVIPASPRRVPAECPRGDHGAAAARPHRIVHVATAASPWPFPTDYPRPEREGRRRSLGVFVREV